MASPITSPVGLTFKIPADQSEAIAAALPNPIIPHADDLTLTSRDTIAVRKQAAFNNHDESVSSDADAEQLILDSYRYPDVSNAGRSFSGRKLNLNPAPPNLQHASLFTGSPQTGRGILDSSKHTPDFSHSVSAQNVALRDSIVPGSVASILPNKKEGQTRAPESVTALQPNSEAPPQILDSPAENKLCEQRGGPATVPTDSTTSAARVQRSPLQSAKLTLVPEVSLNQLRASPVPFYSSSRKSPIGSCESDQPRRYLTASSPTTPTSAFKSEKEGKKVLPATPDFLVASRALSHDQAVPLMLGPYHIPGKAERQDERCMHAAHRIPRTSNPSYSSTSSPPASSPQIDHPSSIAASEGRPRGSIRNNSPSSSTTFLNLQLSPLLPDVALPASSPDYVAQSPSPNPSTASQATHSVSSDSSAGKMSHSRSFSGISGLARPGSFRTKRRPSLPTIILSSDMRSEKSVDTQCDAVVQLGKTEFEFIMPNASRGNLQKSISTSTISSLEDSAWTGNQTTASEDLGTDGEPGSGLTGIRVTRPSDAAKNRARSVYIQNQYVEPIMSNVDQHSIHSSGTSPMIAGSSNLNDAKGLESYRARELKVRTLKCPCQTRF